jgi:signal transduction histidine kinase/ActR/RegA family two-component response regulator
MSRSVTSILSSFAVDVPADSAPRTPVNPASRSWIGYAVFAVSFVVWAWSGVGATTLLGSAISTLAFVPLNFGAVYHLWRSSKNAVYSPSERSGWSLLAGMYVLTALGNASWAFDETVRRVDPQYSFSDLFYFASYVVGCVALCKFPLASRGIVEVRKVLLDFACIVIALGALLWTFILDPLSWPTIDSVQIVIRFGYPIACIGLIGIACRLLMRQDMTRDHNDRALIAIAVIAQSVVDLILEIDYRNSITTRTPWAAAICPLLYILIIFAAERSANRRSHRPRVEAGPSLNPVNLLPTIAGVAVYAVLIWAARSGRREPLGVLVGAAMGLNVLFLAKQAIAVRENAKLLAARAESESRARYEERAREGQKLEAIGRLAGGLAHDFNNLLTTVLANSEFALTRLRPGDVAHEEVSDIRSAAVRGADLIRQLLAFSRKSVIAPVRLQPDLVLRDIERLLQRLAGDRSALVLNLPADLGIVQMDRGQLEQALANLVTNARDAMPDGGTITISGRNTVLDEPAATTLAVSAGEYVTIAVHDNGVGIAEDVRGHIFEPFFSTKARGKGTGLGLASTYGIMRQSNGAIDVRSAPHEGSCFTLYLPRVFVDAPVRAPVVAAVVSGARHSRGETILLVEDEAAVRQVTRRILVSEGYQVMTAGDATAARAMFEQHGDDIKLMISDVMMPGETGPELAAYLRQRWPGLAVIFISGYSDSELPDDGIVDAADDFVQKPFTGEQLLARVDARLRLARRSFPTSYHSQW